MNIFTLQKLREQYEEQRDHATNPVQTTNNFINTQIGTISGGVVITGGQNQIRVIMDEKGHVKNVEATEIVQSVQSSLSVIELSTPEAMAIWDKLKLANLVDDNFQPLVNKTEAALIAAEMADKLKLDHRWTYFETLWLRKNMRNDYQRALESAKSAPFIDRLKKLL